jgi:hypothetical protein
MYCATGPRTQGLLFQHSSFLAGAPVRTGGELKVVNGVVKTISNASGHYQPSLSSLRRAVDWLKESGAADVQQVQLESW